MPHLFDEFKLRDLTLRNRIGVSPMCQYSSEDGLANDWHLVHLGARAVGGAGLVMMEATAVTPEGRITPKDNGIWLDSHVDKLKQITTFIRTQGAASAIQLAHAGRKASRKVPWEGGTPYSASDGGWQVIGPSPIAFGGDYAMPRELTESDIKDLVRSFADAAKRSVAAGFDLVEIHSAHGYLLHSFLSPLSNHRKDSYGGSLENRCRFLIDVTRAVRAVLPASMPLAVRLSCSDWEENGWRIQDSVSLSKLLKEEGVDLVDCSSGGNTPTAKIPVGASYQVPFATDIRKNADIPTAAVGMITEPMQADDVIRTGRADLVFLARELLRDPYWPLHAAKTLHQAKKAPIPVQYARAFT